ncbi:type VII secretion target [Nocardia sp. NPDC006630]|uniref:type VII secretion target n=1 Tax=Nocardia sp. NPDC006630 TaxID=3157181 RepID=UPI0033AAC9B8
MPDSMDIDPAVLRQLADQHDQVAVDTRHWSEPPHEWLGTFQDSYGKIADPVHQALLRYYDARQKAGIALALEHNHTAAALRAAADNYEKTDHESAAAIGRAADPQGSDRHDGQVPATAPPNYAGAPANSPAGTGRAPVNSFDPQPGAAVVPAPPAHGAVPDPGAGATPGNAGSGAPNGAVPAAAEHPADAGVSPVQPPLSDGLGTSPGAQISNIGDGGSAAAPLGGDRAPLLNGFADTMIPGGGMPPMSSDQSASTAPADATAGAGDAVPPPILLTPFGAAVAAAKRQEAEPAHVVNAFVNDDLVLARTLLGAVLAAVDAPAIGLSWAVSVMRGPEGSALFITSNEGRGWLPAGLFLPRAVSSPWVWDELLGAEGGSPWEGVSDPARVLAEFGLAWGPRAGAGLSALVSSGPIDSGLRARFTEVAMEGLVGPAYDVDLRTPTADTADRLGLLGSVSAAEMVAAVPDSEVRARTVKLAAQAHAQLVRAQPTPPESAEVRVLRDRVLAMVQAGQPVGRRQWDELREADELLAASMLSRRVDVGRVDLGALRIDEEGSLLRAMVFERRCDELVLLLAQEPSRQGLRDAAYAFEQIMNHPRFVEVPAAVAVPETEGVSLPAVSGISVVSSTLAAGPPTGASVSAPESVPVVAEQLGG